MHRTVKTESDCEGRVVLQSLTAKLRKLEYRYDNEQRQHKQTLSSLHHLSELLQRLVFFLQHFGFLPL